jgi:predicted transcriptional regulator
MTDERKNIFIDTVEALFTKYSFEDNIPQEAFDFFEDYKKGRSSNRLFTEKGIAILKEMREVNDWISAKALGERMDVSGRSVSGTMRKLVTDGYIEKQAGTPAAYKITEAGMTCNFEENE